jgi:plastocyanin
MVMSNYQAPNAMRTFSFHAVALLAMIVSLFAHPNPVSAATVNVTVAPNGNLVFSPSSVTIHTGDTVHWTWGATFHSTTSGVPGAPNGIWDSGILSQGANFNHTFNSAGNFPYYCTPHGGCCNMVGMVNVVSETPTPTPQPTSTPTGTPRPTQTPTPRPTDGCYPNFTTAEGCDALKSLTNGAGNTGLGWRSLFVNTTGGFNTGVGGGALALNNADSNTAVGVAALLLNTSGTQNTAVGTDTLVFNDTGDSNTATGYFALMNNTTGSSNTAIGWQALTANINGANNVALGTLPLSSNTSGDNNTAIGNQALESNVTTNDHVAIGRMAGSGLTTANNNIIIGHHSGVHSVFGQVSDRCTIDNISGAPVSAATAAMVMVDSDGRLGTVTMDGPDPGGFSSKGIRPQAIPDAAKQAILNLKVENLQATITQQQQQIETLTAQLKEQAAQIQEASAELQMSKPPVNVASETSQTGKTKEN